ncbi:amidohydrolase [Abditibacterium utsteinense]|uniref:Amidohydrolase n=1 Tax=Abditibacterium utsteinense TaxID=1960156 RepID=A0A2S8SX77_9BACT|nr:amidohydrolase [Abditibacterium utsteinense]PQV65396.1 amidohydrolase [Abditibacterium utsteinense]
MISPELQKNAVSPSLQLPWEEDVVALRRDFHAHPELGFEEVRTARIVAQRLRDLGLEVTENVGQTGVVALLRGGKPGPCVLVRADMDALPIEEENAWQWKSKNAGKMHACGHDAHTAIGLSVARILTQEKDDLAGTVKFMFQPAEEGLGGAGRMIRDGVLENPKPDFALALHVWSALEKGTIGVSSGPVMACTDEFRARIIGQGGHGALPHQTIDAILMAAHVVTALQSVVSRNVKPLDAAVVTVGKIEAGTAFNIIPGEASLEGTLRAFEPEVRKNLETRCREIIETLPKAFGGRGEWQFFEGFPAVVNDEAVTQRITPALQSVAGKENVAPFEPTLGAEDFSLVLQEIPGCFFFVGARNAEIDAVYPHHHPKFNIDESALHLGARALVAAVKELLS